MPTEPAHLAESSANLRAALEAVRALACRPELLRPVRLAALRLIRQEVDACVRGIKVEMAHHGEPPREWGEGEDH
jgi:hypothetical protein